MKNLSIASALLLVLFSCSPGPLSQSHLKAYLGAKADYESGNFKNAAASLDALYISRFDHDFLVYLQSRGGYSFLNWNANLTTDVRRQDWANFVETGPGLRIPLPQSMYMTFNALRGRYLIDKPGRRATFSDLRAGFWYAISR